VGKFLGLSLMLLTLEALMMLGDAHSVPPGLLRSAGRALRANAIGFQLVDYLLFAFLASAPNATGSCTARLQEASVIDAGAAQSALQGLYKINAVVPSISTPDVCRFKI
jgi:hypothetical protein